MSATAANHLRMTKAGREAFDTYRRQLGDFLKAVNLSRL